MHPASLASTRAGGGEIAAAPVSRSGRAPELAANPLLLHVLDLIEGEKSLVVFGADGKLLRKAEIQGDDFSLGYSSIAGMVEVPGKGLFLYVGIPKEKGSSDKVADILRIENVAK